jgi:opacity protein-like surface antigen
MKKNLITALSLTCAVLGSAAQAIPYYLPSSDSTRDLPPYRYATPSDAEVSGSFSLEIGATYTDMCIKKLHKEADLDPFGADITGIIRLNDNLSFTLRFTGTSADQTIISPDLDRDRLKLTSYSVMPGIRYSAPLSDRANCFIGANFGTERVKAKYDWVHLPHADHDFDSGSSSESGIAFSIETGMNYFLCDHFYLYGAVQLWGSKTKIIESDRTQIGVGARVGAGISF